MAKAFAKDFNFTGDLYVDQDRKVYKALECKRGLGAVLGVKALKKYKEALAEGHSQGGTQGDGMQLGGTFLVTSSGEIVWSHMESFAGDHASTDEIIKAIKNYLKK